ncbi:DUF192 domain-containing protein [Rhodocaloribacter litoris]|uniref:DUF192 domain-containing protein n=1 Tax=Rhodocaloribacter litoris TaxID=2558931 RepID=UPI0014231C81|nr:DUF192 domain-containing protein [Rhodocaloribacter litoris]QXD15930.1 DUF192 domain-containing protein [Rhodocaloribacter litoris]GIV60166.1 MAG: hypothetical protein KatS3mg043_1255 [Rhodothermaceae bacterium]
MNKPTPEPRNPARLLLCSLAFLLFGLAACGDGSGSSPAPATPDIPFRKDGTLTFLRDGEPVVTIDIEIADTDSARTRGLMQRTGLPERSGMLFIFPQAEPQSFWMANTPLSLDILFVGPDSQIVSISKYTTPLSPENITSEGLPARFVIEVEAGFVDTYGIVETDRVRWEDLR